MIIRVRETREGRSQREGGMKLLFRFVVSTWSRKGIELTRVIFVLLPPLPLLSLRLPQSRFPKHLLHFRLPNVLPEDVHCCLGEFNVCLFESGVGERSSGFEVAGSEVVISLQCEDDGADGR